MIQGDYVFGYTQQLTHKEWAAILAWPGYRVYRHEVDEEKRMLKLWVRRKPIHRGFECSGCGRRLAPRERFARAGDPGPAMERVSRDGGCGSTQVAVPGMWGSRGKDRATTLQGA